MSLVNSIRPLHLSPVITIILPSDLARPSVRSETWSLVRRERSLAASDSVEFSYLTVLRVPLSRLELLLFGSHLEFIARVDTDDDDDGNRSERTKERTDENVKKTDVALKTASVPPRVYRQQRSVR